MWQQQMQQRRLSDAGLVSKQGKATNIKQRCDGWSWNMTIKGAGQIIAIKTGEKYGGGRLGQIGLLAFGHAVIHQLAHQQGLEFENVLPGMSSTSISAHLWRKPKQLCVLCAVRWLSREGGYLGWGSSYTWSSKLVDGSSINACFKNFKYWSFTSSWEDVVQLPVVWLISVSRYCLTL